MLKRSPIIAVFIAAFITAAIIYLFEFPSRPFSKAHIITLYIISYCVALGIALFFDPEAANTRKKLLKINFYEEK